MKVKSMLKWSSKFKIGKTKYKIRQHIPSYVSGIEPKIGEFGSLQELLSIEWVAKWKINKKLNFFRYSISGNKLMAEFDNGKDFWVIGKFLDDLSKIKDIKKLPEWKDPDSD